jgi:hypothetical protein
MPHTRRLMPALPQPSYPLATHRTCNPVSIACRSLWLDRGVFRWPESPSALLFSRRFQRPAKRELADTGSRAVRVFVAAGQNVSISIKNTDFSYRTHDHFV